MRTIFSRTQTFFICFGIVAQLSFVESIRYFLDRGAWGYPRLGWVIPNRVLDLGLFELSSNLMISLHAITSFALYGAVLVQLGIMIYVRPSVSSTCSPTSSQAVSPAFSSAVSPALHTATNKIKFHRLLGRTIIFVLLPLFVVFALILNVQLIHRLTNQILFGVIPVMVTYGFVKALHAIRHRDQASHIDAIFLVIMCLNAAPITRLCVGVFYAAGFPSTFLMQNHEPTVLGAVVRTFLIILILFFSYLSCERLKRNVQPIVFLAAVLGVALWVV